MKKRLMVLTIGLFFLCVNGQVSAKTEEKENEKELYLVEFNEKNQKENQKKFGKEHTNIKKEFKHLNLTTVYMNKQQAEALKKNPTVKSIIKNGKIEIKKTEAPDEIEKSYETPIRTKDWAYKAVNIDENLKGDSINVGIVDDPILDSYEFNFNKSGSATCTSSKCGDLNDVKLDKEHGTMMAGIINAKRDNGNDVNGIAPNATIYSLDFEYCNIFLYCTLDSFAMSLEHAIDYGFDVINMSFMINPKTVNQEEKEFIYSKLTETYESGVYLVASAGNNDEDDFSVNDFPSAHPLVTTVTGVYKGSESNKYIFYEGYNEEGYTGWSRGPEVDITAPGVNVYTTKIKEKDSNSLELDYGYSQGTSLAAPFVTGIVALAKEKYPEYSNDDIYALLMLNTKELPDYFGVWNKKTGYGLVQGTFNKTLTKVVNDVHVEDGKTGYYIPKKKRKVDSNSNEKTQSLLGSDYPSKTYYDSNEGRFYQVKKENLSQRPLWVTYGRPLIKDIDNAIIFKKGVSYENEMYDENESDSNWTSFSPDSEIRNRFEKLVTVQGLDIQFNKDNGENPLTISLYDNQGQLLNEFSVKENGVFPIEKTEHVAYYSLSSKTSNQVKLTEIQLLGTSENTDSLTKAMPIDLRSGEEFYFHSTLSSRTFYSSPTDIIEESDQETVTADNITNKLYTITGMYGWDENKHQYRWYKTNLGTDTTNSYWIRLTDEEMNEPIYNNDLMDNSSGQFVYKNSASYQRELFDNIINYAVFKENGYVDYEFENPINIYSYFIEHVTTDVNPQVELTFYKEGEEGNSELVKHTEAIGENEFFKPYNQLENPQFNVKKIRIKNMNSSNSVNIEELAFFGIPYTTTEPKTISYHQEVILPKGEIKYSAYPTGILTPQTLKLEQEYKTTMTEGHGVIAPDSKFKWIKVKLPNGAEAWVDTVINGINSPSFEKGLMDVVNGQVVDQQNSNYLKEINDNVFNYALIGSDGYAEYRFDYPISVNQLFFKLNEEVDTSNVSDKIDVELLDAQRDTLYKRTLTRDDLYKQLFDLPATYTGVYGFKITNKSTNSLQLSELEFMGNYTNAAKAPVDINRTATLGSSYYEQKMYDEIGGAVVQEKNLSNKEIIMHKGYWWNSEQARHKWYLISVPSEGIDHVWTQLENLPNINIYRVGVFEEFGIANTVIENGNYAGDFTDNDFDYGFLYGNGSIAHTLNQSTTISKAYVKLYDKYPYYPTDLVYEFYDANGTLLGSHTITKQDLYDGYFDLGQTYQNVKSMKLINKASQTLYISEVELF